MLTIDPCDLAAAVERDTLAVESIAEGRSSFKVLPGGKPNEEHWLKQGPRRSPMNRSAAKSRTRVDAKRNWVCLFLALSDMPLAPTNVRSWALCYFQVPIVQRQPRTPTRICRRGQGL